MISPPQLVDTSYQLMACIQISVPREQIRHVMDPGLQEILGALADQGIEPSGPWFTHHFRIVPEIFEFEICVPVDKPVKPVGRVQPGEWPAMTVARTVYNGPYGGLGAAWKEFNEWISANSHEPAEDLWERYILSPPSAPQTELNRPIKPARR